MNQRTSEAESSKMGADGRLGWGVVRRPELVFLALATVFAGLAWSWRTFRPDESRAIEVGERRALDSKVRVNVLDAQGLTVIPGIGDKLASDIVEERGKNGPFRDLADIGSRVKRFRTARVGEFEKYLDFTTEPEKLGE